MKMGFYILLYLRIVLRTSILERLKAVLHLLILLKVSESRQWLGFLTVEIYAALEVHTVDSRHSYGVKSSRG